MSEVVPDPMAAEQTWPSEQELKEADGEWAWHVSGRGIVVGVWPVCSCSAGEEGCQESAQGNLRVPGSMDSGDR